MDELNIAHATKICTKCHEARPLTEFGVTHRRRQTRHMSVCKECRKPIRRLQYLDNVDKVREQSAAWAAANPDQRRQTTHSYYLANKEKINARSMARAAADPERKREDDRAWRAANKEKCAGYTKKYKDSNPDKIAASRESLKEWQSAYGKLWRARNPDKQRDKDQRYKSLNKSKIAQQRHDRRLANLSQELAKERASAAANSESRAETCRAWRARNPEMVNVFARARRARKRGAEGSHTTDDVASIRKAQKNRCAYCCELLGRHGHLDHIISLSKGGSNWPRNLQWLCQPCNNHKAAKDPIEYARECGRLL